MKRNVIIILFAAGLLTSCFNEGTLVENPAPLMQYQHKPTEARLLAVAKAYAEAINRNLADKVVHPGQYADYGVALAKLGCQRQANVMLNNEKMLFPNSTAYVDMLRQSLVPAQLGVSLCDTSKIDLATLDTIRVVLTPEEQALQNQIASDPEYQRQLKEQAKAEREQQALAKKKEQKENAKAKKQAQAEKEKQKKADMKAREKEKKAAQKAKEKERKQAAKAKEQAKKEAQKAKQEAAKATREAAKAKQESSKATQNNEQ